MILKDTKERDKLFLLTQEAALGEHEFHVLDKGLFTSSDWAISSVVGISNVCEIPQRNFLDSKQLSYLRCFGIISVDFLHVQEGEPCSIGSYNSYASAIWLFLNNPSDNLSKAVFAQLEFPPNVISYMDKKQMKYDRQSYENGMLIDDCYIKCIRPKWDGETVYLIKVTTTLNGKSFSFGLLWERDCILRIGKCYCSALFEKVGETYYLISDVDPKVDDFVYKSNSWRAATNENLKAILVEPNNDGVVCRYAGYDYKFKYNIDFTFKVMDHVILDRNDNRYGKSDLSNGLYDFKFSDCAWVPMRQRLDKLTCDCTATTSVMHTLALIPDLIVHIKFLNEVNGGLKVRKVNTSCPLEIGDLSINQAYEEALRFTCDDNGRYLYLSRHFVMSKYFAIRVATPNKGICYRVNHILYCSKPIPGRQPVVLIMDKKVCNKLCSMRHFLKIDNFVVQFLYNCLSFVSSQNLKY